ncbi:MAG: gliding motility-associated C-terminal domain-containing protein [Crocinitomicaceae bacterium]|nr:gliding motility-associated C-terminal domain-containing protein [Crocinitomicaceae bacterium]
MKLLAKYLLLLLTTLLLNNTQSSAQCGPLSTPYVDNNGQSGIMFDIVALQSVNITELAMDFTTGSWNMEIYFVAGTHVGNETNAAAWTLLGTLNGWNATGGSNVLIPITFSQFLCAGDVGAFYVTASNSTGGNYSNGTGVGNVAAADANIQVLEGTGKAYPFGTNFTPRVPNVTVYYDCATSCCLPPTMTMTQETCSGACDGTATATVGAGGVGPYTYQWDAAAGNQITQTAINLCAGTYSINVTDNTGCVSTNTITVTSGGATTTPTFNPITAVCQNDPAPVLLATSTNGITGTWAPVVSTATAGTTTYTFTPDAGQCALTATLDIVVNTAMSPTFDPITPVCQNDPNPTLLGTSLEGVTGAWAPIVSTATLGITTYTFTPDPGQCSTTGTLDINVTTPLTPTFNAITPVCQNDPNPTLAGTSLNGFTGTWAPAVSTATLGTTTYTFTPDIGQCAIPTTLDIFVTTPIIPTFDPITPVCQNAPNPTLLTTSLNGYTGAWAPAVSTAILGTTTYTFTPDAGQCATTTTLDINVTTPLTPTFNAITPVCQNDPNPTLAGTSLNGFTGTWSPVVSTTMAGTTTYTFTPDAGQCATIATLDITVDPTYDLNQATLVCINESVTYPDGTSEVITVNTIHVSNLTTTTGCDSTITTSVDIIPTDDSSISYSSASYCLDAQNPAPIITGLPGGFFFATPIGVVDPITGVIDIAATGVGTFNIEYTTNGTCPSSSSFAITILPLSDATILDAGPFCTYDEPYQLYAAESGGVWSGTGVDSITGIFDPSQAIPGVNDITYTINSQCPNAYTLSIDVYEPPTISTIDDTTITIGESIDLITTGTATSFDWTPSSTLDCSTCQDPEATPETTTAYEVTAEGNGCYSTDIVLITVYIPPIIYVPNIFSPNGDNNNDVLYVRGQGVNTVHFRVYDRWGEKVFESLSLEEGWDGVFRGKKMNPAVYMYYVDVTFLDGTELVKKGDVTLVR